VPFVQPPLGLKAMRAAAFPFGQERAEWIFVLLSMERQAEELDWSQRQRKAGRLREGPLIIAVELRSAKSVEQFLVLRLETSEGFVLYLRVI